MLELMQPQTCIHVHDLRRHMCVCRFCAAECIRSQDSKCPICRNRTWICDCDSWLSFLIP